MKLVKVLLLIFAAAVAPAFAASPVWDSSGNGQLSGTYYFRQVLYETDGSGNTSAAYTFFGNIAFSGNSAGTYTVTNGTYLQDTANGLQSESYTPTGTYSVSASGYGFMSSPLISGANVVFLVSNHILIGSETESGYNTMFIAAPYSSTLTSASLSGSYTIAGFFINGTPATSADATYQLNTGSSTVSITGTNGAGTTLSQNSSGVKYTFSSGALVITYPTNNTAPFYSGQVYLYASPDGNFIFGGAPGGIDMFVGVRNAPSGSTPLSGLYYEAGFDESIAPFFDSYYGVFNAFQGNIVAHERTLFSGGNAAEGVTYYDNYPTSLNNTYQSSAGGTQYTVGADGIRIGTGIGEALAITVALPYAPPAATTSVYLDPTGIVNTASSAPYTAGVSPGDFLTLYNGVNLANSTVFAPAGPFPTKLGGVQVLVDGIPAPIYYVSATQVSFLVPYAASTYPIASIQVNNNGTLSNTATTYVYQTTPGVFTADPVGGIGIAAMLDFPASGANYFIVSENQPAQPGDAVALYLTGLGSPFPPNGDGQLGSTTGCLAGTCLVNSVAVDIGGTDVGTLAFAGLAPDLAGLYQINFTVPALCTSSTQTSCVNTGEPALGITGEIAGSGGTIYDSYSDEALIPIGSGAGSARSSSTPVSAARRKLPPRMTRAGNR